MNMISYNIIIKWSMTKIIQFLLFAKSIASKAFMFAVAARTPKEVMFAVAADNVFVIVNSSISCNVLLIIILSYSSCKL